MAIGRRIARQTVSARARHVRTVFRSHAPAGAAEKNTGPLPVAPIGERIGASIVFIFPAKVA